MSKTAAIAFILGLFVALGGVYAYVSFTSANSDQIKTITLVQPTIPGAAITAAVADAACPHDSVVAVKAKEDACCPH